MTRSWLLPCRRHITMLRACMRVLAGGRPPGRPRGIGSCPIFSSEVDEEVRREQLQKLWERYGNLPHRRLRPGGRRGRRLAGLRMVGGQEGRRGRLRFPGRRRAVQRGQEQGGRGGVRQAGGQRHVELSHARANSARRPKWRATTRRRRWRSTTRLAADGSLGRVLQDLAALRAGDAPGRHRAVQRRCGSGWSR